MYPEKPPHATARRSWPTRSRSKQYPPLRLFELRVALDKFFGAASREAHREAAVFVFALHSHDRSNAKARMANLAPQHGTSIAVTFCCGVREGTLSHLATRSCLCLPWSAAHTAQELFPWIGILGIGLVTARFANFRHRAANRFYQLAGNFRKKARGQGSPQLLFIAEDAPVD